MKFLRSRKGQATLEYLATYGWAILILGVVGIVLWQMGVFTPPSPPPDCRGFSQIRPIDWKLLTDGTFEMIIINQANTKLNITAGTISVEIENQGGAACQTPGPISDEGITAGGSIQVTGYTNCIPSTIASGEYYRAQITIPYLNAASGMTHNSVGVCWADVE